MPRRRRPPPYDPLAPVRPRALRRQVTRDVALSSRPLAAIISRSMKGAAENVSGIANQLAQSLGGYQATERDIYQRQNAELGKIDDNLSSQLGTAGQASADALRARLAQAGQDPALADQLAGAAAGIGHGAGVASLGRGSAEQAALAQRQAAAEEFAAKLPGFAQLSGLQGVQLIHARGQKDLTDLAQRQLSTIPALLSAARNRELNKAVARMGNAADIYGINTRAATSRSNNAATNATSRANQATRTTETRRHNQRTERQQRWNERGRNRRANKNGGGSAPWKTKP